MRCTWAAVLLAGCGSVTANTTDPSAGSDAGGGEVGGGDTAPAGTVRWVRSLSALSGTGVADGPGGLIVTGYITAPTNLGGATLTPVGGVAMVIAGLDASDARHEFSVSHGGTGNAYPFMHDINRSGSPIVFGVSSGPVDLGAGMVAGGSPDGTINPPADGYLGLYGVGAPSWVARIVGPGEDKIVASALGPGSTVYGGGWFVGTAAFNGGSLSTSSVTDRDIFLARFNVFTGAVDLTRTYGDAGLEEISGMDSLGETVVATGHFDETSGLPAPGSLVFGGTAEPLVSNGGHDVWVAKLDSKGDGIWAKQFGSTGEDRDPRIAVDAAGDVYVTGSFTGQVGFGAINLISRGGPDVFLAKLHGADGTVAWAISLGSVTPTSNALNDAAGGIAVDAAGHVVITGRIAGPLDDAATSAGGLDAFIASFDAATGAQRWRKVISTAGDDFGGGVSVGNNGDVYAIIGLGDAFDFGMPIVGPAGPASVLLRIVP
jgi:hypothetical protein